MKFGTLKRLAALLVCLSMLLSGLSFADELGGGSLAPVEQHEEQPSTGEVGDEAKVNTPDADAPGESDPEGDMPSDIVVSEGDTSDEDEEPGETEAVPSEDEEPDETETVPSETEQPGETEAVPSEDEEPDETKTVPGETEQPGVTEAVPGGEELPEGDPDPSADNETDPSLEEADGEVATLQTDGDIMLMAAPECEHKPGEEMYTEDNPISCVSANATQHKIRYEHVEYYICEKCGNIIPETYKSEIRESDMEDHQRENGKCALCHYECTHPNAEVGEWTEVDGMEPEYYSIDSVSHTKQTYEFRTVTCDCGLADGEETRTVEVVEPHTFEDGDVCACGYVKNSVGPHDHADYWECWDTDVTYDRYESGGLMCKGIGRTETRTYYCGYYDPDTGTLCNYMNPEVETVYTPGEFYIPHEFSNGVCVNCHYGASGECKHPNPIRRHVTTSDLFATEIVPCGNGTHKGIMLVTSYYYCPDCGVNFSRETEEEVTEPCTLVYDGESAPSCSVCGYVEETDYFPLEYDEDTCLEKYGEHLWVRASSEQVGAGKVIDSGDWYHTRADTMKIISKYCARCGARSEDETVDAGHAFTEPHEFEGEGDTCVVCEKKRPVCNHPEDARQTETFFDWEEAFCGYRDINEEGHTIVFLQVEETWCTECWEHLSYTSAPVEMREAHNFNMYGVCTDCGWVSKEAEECPHDGGTTTVTIYMDRDTIYTDPDNMEMVYFEDCADEGHRVYGMYHTYTVCKLCGLRMPGEVETGVDTGRLEAHDFVTVTNGDLRYRECTKCGYSTDFEGVTCEHPNLKSHGTPLAPKISYKEIPGDDKQHTVITSKGWECPDCGEEIYPEDEVTTETVAHSYDRTKGDGVCPDCKHPCSDAAKKNDAEQPAPVTTYKPEDDHTHTVVVTTTMTWTCPDCGKKGTNPAETKETPNQQHDYKDGVCSQCKHACTHDGGAAKVMDDAHAQSTYTADDAAHTPATVTPWTCDICKLTGEDPAKTGDPEAHSYQQNAEGAYECSVCHHVCEHSNATETTEPTGEEKYETTVETHQKYVEMHVTVTCPDCGNVKEYDEFRPEGAAEGHKWDAEKGECSVCGYKCTHQYGKPVETVEWGKYAADDDVTHTRTGTKVVTETCTVCGNVKETQTQVEDEQPHTYVDGVCSDPDCQHVCEHKGADLTSKDPVTEITGREEIPGDDAIHKTVGTVTTEYTCEYCGETVEDETEVEPYEGTEGHSYEDGVCTVCGHACGHSKKTTVDEFVPDGTYKSNGAKGHTASGRVDLVTTCDDCGEELERIQGTELVTRDLPHNFENGKCTLCGYVKPAPVEDETDAQEKVDDEPIFEPVEKGTVMHGLSVGDGSRMATALCKVIDGIQAEYGADVRIFVLDADKILTAEEYRALGALPMREQLLVVLTALGYVDEVQAGMGELDIELSQAARDLIDEIAQRLDGMTEAERAEYLALLAQYFPAMVDADAQHTEIVLEMHVKLDEGYRMERYGFDLRDGKWYYARLDVAGAND